MKLAVVLESPPGAGGAYRQAISAILQMQRLCAGRHEFEVVTTHAANLGELQRLGLSAWHRKISLADRLVEVLALNPAWQFLQRRTAIAGPFERALIRRGVDLVYFLTQSSTASTLTRLNFIATVFDLAHRDHPEFPEAGNAGAFQHRDRHFRHNLPRAVAIVTAAPELSASISRRYGVDAERMVAMPFSVPATLDGDAATATASVLAAYALSAGYFFYPAQYWAHKNHIRILDALRLLRQSGIERELVFAGGDHGNRAHIEAYAQSVGLTAHVRFLGFVPAEHLRGLYEGCCALVMPTYFGPTNLPPLEAWHLQRPLVYSAHLRDDAGDAAAYADPDDAQSLAEAMRRCLDPAEREQLVRAGEARLEALAMARRDAELVLARRLDGFAAKRSCWP